MSSCLSYQEVYKDRRAVLWLLRLKIIALTILLVTLTARIYIKVSVTRLGYELSEARREAVSLDLERRELALQMSVLMRRDHLLEASEKRLQLGLMSPNKIITVNQGGN